ncbi:MAG: hypothetical protein ACE1Y8_03500 [Acidimicrobiia bacterium]
MTHHRRGLRRLLRDDDLAQRIEADFESAGISDKRLVMLRYAAKLTKDPGSVAETDVGSMRQVGFSDTDILHIAEVTGYYAYANRIADGLGIPLEDWIPED